MMSFVDGNKRGKKVLTKLPKELFMNIFVTNGPAPSIQMILAKANDRVIVTMIISNALTNEMLKCRFTNATDIFPFGQ